MKNMADITSLVDYGEGCLACGNRAAIPTILAKIARLAVEARAELLIARAEEEE